jgi:hypothetical protein
VGGGNVWHIREHGERDLKVVLNAQYVKCSRICVASFVTGTMGVRGQESGIIIKKGV